MKYLFLLFVLSACAAPQPVFKPVEVDVPVLQGCAVPDLAPPDFAVDHVTAKDALGAKTQALLATLDQHRGYEEQLKAQIALCR